MQEQYFIFLLQEERYAFEALDVLEIVNFQNITQVPTMSKCISGVTNIRGNLIAVVDLLQRLEVEKTTLTNQVYFSILKKRYLDKELQIAVMIDEALEVDSIEIHDIESTPNFGTNINKRFIKSMAKYKDEYIPVLNIDSLLDIDEISMLNKVEG